MRLLYDIFFILFSVLYLPYFLLKGKYHRDYLQRFGVFKKGTFARTAQTKPVWLHAVSVGEMTAAEGLIQKMRTLFPDRGFVISNLTKTGHDIAVRAAGEKDTVIYFPMDISFIVRKLTALIGPALFITMETEIWPNLITELHSKGVPIALMNGRISTNSFRNYRLIRPVIGDILKKVTLFCMRTEGDAERIKELGAPSEKVKVTGNMKFDRVFIKKEGEEGRWAPLLNTRAWLPDEAKLIIAGSTHRGEDIRILRCYKALKNDSHDLRLLIAPRHVERSNEIAGLVEQSDLRPVRISQVEEACEGRGGRLAAGWGDDAVFILDSMGHLSSLYRLATVVFMGGSLVPHGGHNFIEPAAYAKPVVTGPHIDNFRDMSELFAKNDAIEVARNDHELSDSLRRLSTDKERQKKMGERARKVVLENVGSTDRNISLIRHFL